MPGPSQKVTCEQVLAFIKSHIAEKGYPPSQPEIGEAFDIGIDTVKKRIRVLRAEGFITMQNGVARGIRVVDSPPQQSKPSPAATTKYGRQLNKSRRLCSREFCTNERAPHSQWCAKCAREFVSRYRGVAAWD